MDAAVGGTLSGSWERNWFEQNPPASACQSAARISELLNEIERLRDHIFDHAEFAEYRIKDGDELGARVWRIALEDIAKENRTALTGEHR